MSSSSAAVAQSPTFETSPAFSSPIQRYPPTQPPSHKPPDLRKSQLHRQYTSLLRSSPLFLVFQHNNLLASEWAAIRRELATALQNVTLAQQATQPSTAEQDPDIATSIKLQVIQSSIFGAALRVVEFYNPTASTDTTGPGSSEPSSDATQPIPAPAQHAVTPTHGLSREAWLATRAPASREHAGRGRSDAKLNTPLHRLLSGPIALLTFPSIAPEHLAAAISVLAPTRGAASAFPAPRRKLRPSYYDPIVQSGLPKLMLLGARVDGTVREVDYVHWVGGLRGGMDGLRAQLVSILQGAGLGITNVLGSASSSLYGTMESRRQMLEQEDSTEQGQ